MRRSLQRFLAVVFISGSMVLAVPPPDPVQRYALILRGAPLAQQVLKQGMPRTALSSAAADSHRRNLLTSQESVRSLLGLRQIRTTGATQTLLNAVFVVASPSRLAELRAMPEVAGVVRLPVLRPKLNTALDLVNSSAGWAAVGGPANAGAGMKIAILDSGIDETHPGFQDPSLSTPAGFPKSNNADDASHVTNKVIAVRSFVAALAVGDGTPEFTRPDDLTARDRMGHGTAVAMIAAGVSHQSPMGAISGMAPKAWLGNYKIFGSPGVNDASSADVALLALENAFNDGMDVALLSAGSLPSLWAPTDQGSVCGLPAGTFCDPWVAAVSNAARGRMVVVVAAGNDGALGLGTINSPGDAPEAITVGATINLHTLVSSVSTSTGDWVEAQLGDGARPQGAISAPLLSASGVDFTDLGCLGFSPGALSGKIVLIAAGHCSYTSKVLNAQSAGALAVLIVLDSTASVLSPASGLSNTGIPAAVITSKSGAFLKSYELTRPGSIVTLNPSVMEIRAGEGERVAPFSSRGPGIANTGIKPDLVAPGAGIYTATQDYDPNGSLYSAGRYTGADGASFAAAIVAGAAALVKQAHPEYTAAQIKSAVVNSATPGVSDRDLAGNTITARSLAAGAGKLNVQAAIGSSLACEPVSFAFGAVNGGLGSPRSLTITNSGIAPAAIQLTVNQRDADSAATLTLVPSGFNLGPGQSRTVTVSLTGRVPSPGIYEGVIAVSGGSVPLRIPYLYQVGDGKPFQLIPLSGADFVTEAGSAVALTLRALDRYGVPVPNLPVRFAPAVSVYRAAPATDRLGIAEAYIYTSTASGDQSFSADLETNALRLTFSGRTRRGPQISASGVVDGATGSPAKAYAPGSFLTFFGSGLSESLIASHTPYLPLSLGGVSVSFDVAGLNIHVPGRLHFVSPGQVNVQIPWELAGSSSAVMKLTLNGSESQSIRPDDYDLGTYQSQLITLPIAASAPAFFEYSDGESGRRMAAALNETNSVVTPLNPALRGRMIQFFVNGLGPVAAGTQPESGEPATGTLPLSTTQSTPTVIIGNRKALVQFSGLAPLLVGLYQVNAVVPEDIPSGLQPVVISIGGAVSQPSTVAVQ